MIEHGTEYLSTMGDEGTSQRKEYEKEVNFSKLQVKKYKDFLKKHKVATFK